MQPPAIHDERMPAPGAAAEHSAMRACDGMRSAAIDREDDLVQLLAVAKYALAIGETARATEAVDAALALARRALSELVDRTGADRDASYAGTLVRRQPTGERAAAPAGRRVSDAD